MVVSDLYFRGEWDEKLFSKTIAVVGSRRMTEYGRRVLEKMIPRLVESGYTIVSGFMYGIDQMAHRICVECGGKTIAVLGWGIDWKMESGDLKLAEEIIKNGGLLLSQWKDQKPTLWTFPARNRIVADISQEVIVVEAAAKSGSLITVEMALKMGKKVWAVPGPVTASVSVGTNMLIKTGKAEMWLPEIVFRSTNKTDIYTLIQNEPMTVDDIVRRVGRTPEDVGSEITMMLLRGDIVEKDGKYYVD